VPDVQEKMSKMSVKMKKKIQRTVSKAYWCRTAATARTLIVVAPSMKKER